MISCLDRVHQLKKQEVKPSSLYLKLILEQSGYFSMKSTASDKELKQYMPPVRLDRGGEERERGRKGQKGEEDIYFSERERDS